MTAALLPGAAVFVRPAYACSLIQPESPDQFVAEAQLIVIGKVTAASDAELVLQPEAFLKGPASGEPFRLVSAGDMCPRAEVNKGDRVLVYVFDASHPTWPLINEVYELRDGHAFRQGEVERTEIEVVSRIRAITGQYIVPAASDSEGAGIDWGSTIIPVGAALTIVFAIGLVLMRTWHRIDPS